MSQAWRILLALVLGIGFGIAGAEFSPQGALDLTLVTGPIGSAWLHALQMVIVPLIVGLLVTGAGLQLRGLFRPSVAAAAGVLLKLVAMPILAIALAIWFGLSGTNLVIVAVCSDKGSPGVSTLAMGLGMVWPGDRVVLDADTAGGDLPFRLWTADREHRLASSPSVAET